jgi:hypothetical protein
MCIIYELRGRRPVVLSTSIEEITPYAPSDAAGQKRRLGSNSPVADGHTAVAQNAVSRDAQPRPMKGIFVAMTVMNCTLASNGRLAM